MGRALRAAHRLGWSPAQGWWEWSTPMRTQPISFLQGGWGALCHTLRDALRYAAAQRLAARRPRLYAGLGCGPNREIVRMALRNLTELDASLLRGVFAGAIWTAQRAHARGLRGDPACPYCTTGASEDEEHILWDCPRWSGARRLHLADLDASLEQAPLLGPRTSWRPCLRLCGLLPDEDYPEGDQDAVREGMQIAAP